MKPDTVPEPAVLIRALRERLGMTQIAVLEASEGAFVRREDISKFENGQNKATSDQARAGLSRAFGVRHADLAAYLDGQIDLEELLRRRAGAGDRIELPRELVRVGITWKMKGRTPPTVEALEHVARMYPTEPAEGWAKALEVAETTLRYEKVAAKARGRAWTKKHRKDKPPEEAPAPPVADGARHGGKKAANH